MLEIQTLYPHPRRDPYACSCRPSAGTVDDLLLMLAEHSLDRRLEAYGDFAELDSDAVEWTRDEQIPNGYFKPVGKLYPDNPGTWHIHGNFLTYSYAFCLGTDEPAIYEPILAAIRANKERSDYMAQAAPLQTPSMVVASC